MRLVGSGVLAATRLQTILEDEPKKDAPNVSANPAEEPQAQSRPRTSVSRGEHQLRTAQIRRQLEAETGNEPGGIFWQEPQAEIETEAILIANALKSEHPRMSSPKRWAVAKERAKEQLWQRRHAHEVPALETLQDPQATAETRAEALATLADTDVGSLSPEGYSALQSALPNIQDPQLRAAIDRHTGEYPIAKRHVAAFDQEPHARPLARARQALTTLEHPDLRNSSGDEDLEAFRDREARLALEVSAKAQPDQREPLRAAGLKLASGRPLSKENIAVWDAVAQSDPQALGQADLRIANSVLAEFPPRDAKAALGADHPVARNADQLIRKAPDYRKHLAFENAVYQRAGFADDTLGNATDAVSDQRLLNRAQAKLHTFSPLETKRALAAAERESKRIAEKPSPRSPEALAALQKRMERHLPIAQAKDTVARAEEQLHELMDAQGIAGETWDELKQLRGNEANSAQVNKNIDRIRQARDRIADLENFEGSDEAFQAALKKQTTELASAARDTAENMSAYASSQESLETRAMGALQALGGTLEASVGAGLLMTPEPTMLSKAAGTVMAAHGADLAYAGVKALLNGEPRRTFTFQGAKASLEYMGASEEWATGIATGIDFAPSVAGIGPLLRPKRVPALVDDSATGAKVVDEYPAHHSAMFPDSAPPHDVIAGWDSLDGFQAFAKANPQKARELITNADFLYTARSFKEGYFKSWDDAAAFSWSRRVSDIDEAPGFQRVLNSQARYESNTAAIEIKAKARWDHNGAINYKQGDLVTDLARPNKIRANRLIVDGKPLERLHETLVFNAHGSSRGFSGLSTQQAASVVANEIALAAKSGTPIKHVLLASCNQRNSRHFMGPSNAQVFQAELQKQLQQHGLPSVKVLAAENAGVTYGAEGLQATWLKKKLYKARYLPADDGSRLYVSPKQALKWTGIAGGGGLAVARRQLTEPRYVEVPAFQAELANTIEANMQPDRNYGTLPKR